jgi:hypothetical protein
MLLQFVVFNEKILKFMHPFCIAVMLTILLEDNVKDFFLSDHIKGLLEI